MGCNCGGRKRPAPKPKPGQQAQQQQQQQQQGEYELHSADGTRQTFGSRLEAEAANVRNGYNGRIYRI